MDMKIKKIFLPFILLMLSMFLGNTVNAEPQITINSPSRTVSSTNCVEINASIVDTLPVYGFVDWDDSLVGWWCGEGNTNDSSRFGNHGTYMSLEGLEPGYLWPYAIEPTFTDGMFGQAFSFSDADEWLDAGDPDEVNFNATDSFTIAVWVKTPESNSGFTAVEKRKSYRIQRFYDGWRFDVGGRQCRTSSVDTSAWTHLAAVYDGEKKELTTYTNGKNLSGWREGNVGGDIIVAYPLKIGSRNTLVDEVLMFNRVLSPTEIAALYEISDNSFIVTYDDLNEFENHTYRLYAVDSLGLKTFTSEKEILIDVPDTPPRVVLDYPLNDTREDSPTQTFKCTVFNTNRNTQLQRIIFHWDYPGGFVADETKRVTGNIISVEFTKTNLVGKTFEWNCSAVDTHNNSGFAPENFTYIVGRDEYHVAPNGDDNNPGTILLPFRTIQKAADIALPGDTIYIRGGVYRETVIPQSSGNAFAPITFKGYPTEEAVISGADLITGEWTQHQGTIYKTTMNWDLGQGRNQIFVDGKVMMEARWPNADDVAKANWSLIDNYTQHSTYDYTFTDADLPDESWEGALMRFSLGYWAWSGIVTSVQSEALRVATHTHLTWLGQLPGCMYYLIGVLAALDEAGEWVYDSDTLYLWAPRGANPSILTVEAKKRDYAFNLSGKSYINIEDIDIIACAITNNYESHHIVINNMDARYLNHHFVMDGQWTGKGIALLGTDNTIQDSTIDYVSGSGLILGSNTIVQNCTIGHAAYAAGGYAAITGSGKTQNNQILDSTVYNAGGILISISHAQNWSILRNELYGNNYGQELSDLGSIYGIDTDGKGTEIAYNRIHDSYYGGIYLDSGCHNMYIHHNVIWGEVIHWRYTTHGLHGIIMNPPATGNIIYHNTLGDTRLHLRGGDNSGSIIRNTIGHWIVPHTGGYEATEEQIYELYGGLIMQNCLSTHIGLGPKSKDPYTVYVDYDNNDYHLKPGSPAIDAGVDLGFKHDIEGKPITGVPDIGAYEFGTKPGKEDINKDGVVNVQDVQACINHISGTQDWGTRADVNGDGIINETDVQEIIKIILNK